MSNFTLNQQSSTFGSIVIMSGILACQSLPIEMNSGYKEEVYTLDSSGSTFSEYGSSTKMAFQSEPIKDNFEQIVSDFYSKLLANQESLGEEFETVLFNNLWELYED